MRHIATRSTFLLLVHKGDVLSKKLPLTDTLHTMYVARSMLEKMYMIFATLYDVRYSQLLQLNNVNKACVGQCNVLSIHQAASNIIHLYVWGRPGIQVAREHWFTQRQTSSCWHIHCREPPLACSCRTYRAPIPCTFGRVHIAGAQFRANVAHREAQQLVVCQRNAVGPEKI